MLNLLSILGPSRSGKGAITPILAAVEGIELPFNTPDLDWYVSAYKEGELTDEGLCKLAITYLLCYSWYGHLGRHINLREQDYYSFQRMMPKSKLKTRHNLEDKDLEFEVFLKKNDAKTIINVFHWDIPPEIYKKISRRFPVDTNPLYCYRSPYYLFTSWLSSSRVKRSHRLSRMFKYQAASNLKKTDLFTQLEPRWDDNEWYYDEKKEKYLHKKFNFASRSVDSFELNYLLEMLRDNKKQASYWDKKGFLYRFEYIVSEPNEFVEYLKNRLNFSFNQTLLKKGIHLMDKRKIYEVLEIDNKKMKLELIKLKVPREGINEIIESQNEYIKYFNI